MFCFAVKKQPYYTHHIPTHGWEYAGSWKSDTHKYDLYIKDDKYYVIYIREGYHPRSTNINYQFRKPYNQKELKRLIDRYNSRR